MTGRTRLFHLDQQSVLIAIVKDVFDALDVARGLPLLPEFPARPAPEPGEPGFDGFTKRFGIHVRDHQHFVVPPVLDHRRDQPLVIVFEVVGNLHDCGFYHKSGQMSRAGNADTAGKSAVGGTRLFGKSERAERGGENKKPAAAGRRFGMQSGKVQINRLIWESAASSSQEAAPPNSTPSIMSDCLYPMTSIVIWHAISFTPLSLASSSSWPTVATPCLLNIDFIIAVAIASMPGSDATREGIGTGMGIAGLPSGDTFSFSVLFF